MKITTLFTNVFSSVSDIDAHSQEYHNAWQILWQNYPFKKS